MRGSRRARRSPPTPDSARHAPHDSAGFVEPEELFGYGDPSQQPEATGVDKLVLKRGNLFLVANRLGDVAPAGARDLGYFLTDTRHLSSWRLLVQGGPPLCLSTQVSVDYVSQIDFTITGLHEGDLLGKEPVNYVHLRRDQIIDDVFVDRLVLTNFQGRTIDQFLELQWAADFADVFEIRGARRARRGRYARPEVHPDRVVLRYHGLDGRVYVTEIRLEPGGEADGRVRVERFQGGAARLAFHLAAGESGEVAFDVLAGVERVPRFVARPFAARQRENALGYAEWAESCTRFSSSNEAFDRALRQGVADMKALTVYHRGEPVISAGIPWYTCPFGRDALLTGFEAMLVTPSIARQALRFLARLQADHDDPARDAEPGKIPHEIRFGEMAEAGEVPHTPYYGSVDATPLFIILLSEYVLWTDDRALLEELLPAAERAMGWIERAQRAEGVQGFLAYERRTRQGLRNQGWKDSHDGVPFANGTPATPPIALVEAQGYAADARRRLARLYRVLGRHDGASRLLADARALTRQLAERFWMEGKGTFALALDGSGRQVDAVTSNPGHLLFSRAVSEADAENIAQSLLSPPMWSGWGIRTLAKGQSAYNPLSYHNGTVWPHDNALAAMGMAYYGFTRSAGRVLDGLWATAQHFRHLRLPELFCGLDRQAGQFPVHYPVACSPQAWASAAPFQLVRACLGLFPDAPRRTLHITSPVLPDWLDELVLERLQVGPARATLRFIRSGSGTFVSVPEVEGGPLNVRIDLRR